MSDLSHPDQKPTVYILYGDDLYAMQTFLQEKMIPRIGEPGIAELNIARLDGRQAGDEELRTAIQTLPFLAERRLVILSHPLARLTGKSAQEKYKQILDHVPPSTGLVLLIEDEWYGKTWRTLKTDPRDPKKDHWLLRWAREPVLVEGKEQPRPVIIKVFALPRLADMPGWIMKEARVRGGEFTREAAAALANLVGNNTRQASLEIEKILAYVDYQRAVELEDVQIAAAPGGEVNVFEMVDAMGMRDSQQALKLLHTLLEEQEAIAIFGMIVRQFRLLLQVREALDEGLDANETGNVIGLRSSFQVGKLIQQAKKFSLGELVLIYHRLLELDLQSKSGQGELAPALDTFVVNL
ncbi:MAG TPA: DNA polymerase III subunit delta [Anaerolineaceae bacterium]|nr:DNA polymerase III subunit delta [Anaerolineaceae bacterium]HQP60650.1 DNA polymerase III subunit delta [Anaerolineaceae bacterium]